MDNNVYTEPKKPKLKFARGYIVSYCPTCENEVRIEQYVCLCCGQVLEWKNIATQYLMNARYKPITLMEMLARGELDGRQRDISYIHAGGEVLEVIEANGQ